MALQATEQVTMDRRDGLRYDVLIYGQSALLAAEFGKDTKGLRETLEALGVTDEHKLEGVREAQTDKEYEESRDGRGLNYDEGVYEAIKDCLRPVYGF
jgi:hypothetical protein